MCTHLTDPWMHTCLVQESSTGVSASAGGDGGVSVGGVGTAPGLDGSSSFGTSVFTGFEVFGGGRSWSLLDMNTFTKAVFDETVLLKPGEVSSSHRWASTKKSYLIVVCKKIKAIRSHHCKQQMLVIY